MLNQVLPPNEMSLFCAAVGFFEEQKYKMALRCTKKILSTRGFSEHGETLAMNGMILNCMGKHEEALEAVKRGLKANSDSFICWHIFGQVQRSVKNYHDAIEAYKMALLLDSENLQILSDLSLLQIQIRDYRGYQETRRQMLLLSEANNVNWIAYANSCFLLGDYNKALKTVDEFLETKADIKDPDHGSLIHYKVTILQEAGRLSDALDFLEENAAVMPDRQTYLETRADLLFKLGRLLESENVYMQLVERNHDGLDYLMRIEDCKRLLNTDKPENAKHVIKEFYETLIEKYPRNRVVQIRALLFMETKEFQKRFLAYLVAGLRSGLPSLFNSLSMFYEKFEVLFVEETLVDFVKICDELGFENASLDGSPLQELPSTAVWVYYFLAQHFLWHKKYEEALQYVEKAISHTPTLIDLYTLKAKIYKKAGDPGKAAIFMDFAQSLDTADRYLNCKCAKYLLENGQIESASIMCESFTRKGIKSEDALYEMQCLWYPLACAKAYLARKDYGEALKRCHQIDQIMRSHCEDQLDFHFFCARKRAMVAYVSMIRFMDKIHTNSYFVRAAKLATKIYLQLHDALDKVEEQPVGDVSNLSESELKKLRRMANKKKAQEEKLQSSKTDKPQAQKEGLDADQYIGVITSLDPGQLASTKTPLDDASKFLHPAISAKSKDVELYELAFEVYRRKGEISLMFKCLKNLSEIDAKNTKFSSMMETFKKEYEAQNANLPATIVKEVDEFILETVSAAKSN